MSLQVFRSTAQTTMALNVLIVSQGSLYMKLIYVQVNTGHLYDVFLCGVCGDGVVVWVIWVAWVVVMVTLWQYRYIHTYVAFLNGHVYCSFTIIGYY